PGMLLFIEKGKRIRRDDLLAKLVEIQYSRNDIAFERGAYRVRGDSVEVFPAYEENRSIRINFFGDEIDEIAETDPLTGKVQKRLDRYAIYPNSHYVTPEDKLKTAMDDIRGELAERLQEFKRQGKLLEAQRLEQRTMYDLEMIEMMGYCSGIENYSRHLTGRKQGEAPPTLIEYFPKDFLLIIDESHITVPQLIGMYRGDRSRKTTLVEYGFRLPSALDNRPLMFEEFNSYINKVIYVSATPGDYEIRISKGNVVEQIVRPTGLIDPAVEIRPVEEQVDHLHDEIKKRADAGERVLVTTLTKKMAEHLTEHFQQKGLRVRYMHSDIDTLERIDIIRDLRLGAFDCLIGINLLREGLDLPEVSLVAILDADKEGFLRSGRSLIQTFGRAARNLNGKVILYADRMTDSMERAVAETGRRRDIQSRHNKEHGITPRGIERRILWIDHAGESAKQLGQAKVSDVYEKYGSPERLNELLEKLRKEMFKAAANLEFERAAELRDRIKALQSLQLCAGTD
ncbi:MAG: excinuclease ABC subunit UvrB, partial [Deltaproteobacteria bacterium]|nr:excinuclease ABC subunit UvrB [Deltaproteobacteria bacterium]